MQITVTAYFSSEQVLLFVFVKTNIKIKTCGNVSSYYLPTLLKVLNLMVVLYIHVRLHMNRAFSLDLRR